MLAERLRTYAEEQPFVLALPRGGVPVAAEIAQSLGAPLDVWIVRKVGLPRQPELGVGAVAEGGHVCVNSSVLSHLRLTETELAPLFESERREVEARVRKLRGGQPPPNLRGRTVIMVDDGIATGGTALAAIRAVRAQRPKQIILAVPVAGPDAVSLLRREVDRVVYLRAPEVLYAIGTWYRDFSQVSDEEVLRILDEARGNAQEPDFA